MSKGMQAFRIVMAFQHFGGKALRTLDAVEKLPSDVLDTMENALRTIAANLKTDDANEFPDCHKLAEQITKSLEG